MNYVGPIIEEFAEGYLMDQARRAIINLACPYLINLKQGKSSPDDVREHYYYALTNLLQSYDNIRLALYLPFATLDAQAPAEFKEAYMAAWYRLLAKRDLRENFHQGDTFEVDARPVEGLEWVVKAIHLVPWLLRVGYLTFAEIVEILQSTSYSTKHRAILQQSFRDIEPCLRDWELITPDELSKLHVLTQEALGRRKVEPTYISENRKAWLSEMEAAPAPLLTPGAPLEGPFSPNLEACRAEIETIIAQLEPDEIVLIGGSTLKGYGTTRSDLDVHKLSALESAPDFYPGNPHAAHIFFNSVWLGGSAVQNLQQVAHNYAEQYTKVNYEQRRLSLERMEIDLLQLRLLHKGFARMTGEQPTMKAYPEMEGDSVFYNEQYRAIATMLYIKYVYLPTY